MPIPTKWVGRDLSSHTVGPGGGNDSVLQLALNVCGTADKKPQLKRELQTLPAGLIEANNHDPSQHLHAGEETASCPLSMPFPLDWYHNMRMSQSQSLAVLLQ